MRRFSTVKLLSALVLGSLATAGCSVLGEGKVETMEEQMKRTDYKYGSILGTEGGINLFGRNKRTPEQDSANGIGVNSFLWRASLDTLSFMPIVSADPFGGVILTDWYTPPDTPNERFKVNLYILDRQLRADGVRVSVFKQQRAGSDWRDSNVGTDTATTLEDAVLTRARQLRAGQSTAAR